MNLFVYRIHKYIQCIYIYIRMHIRQIQYAKKLQFVILYFMTYGFTLLMPVKVKDHRLSVESTA